MACVERRKQETETEKQGDEERAAEQASRGSAPHEIQRFARKLDVISRQLGTEHTQACARVLCSRTGTHTIAHVPTTYKREMRTLPILATKRSPGASFKLPTVSLALSLSLPLIRLSLLYGYPRLPLPRVSSDHPAVVVRRLLNSSREKARFAAAAPANR